MQNPNSDPTKIVLPSARLVNYCAMPSGLLRRKSRSHAVPGFASFQHQLRAASTTRELLDAMDALETMLCATGSDTERIQLYKADIEAAVEVRLSRCDARAPSGSARSICFACTMGIVELGKSSTKRRCSKRIWS